MVVNGPIGSAGSLVLRLPLIRGLTIMFTLGYVLVALIVDILYAYIDPRIRYL